MDISPLQAAVCHYYQNGLAASTHKCYTVGQHQYLNFCTSYSLSPLPISEYILMLFVSHLALSGLAHTLIKTYFSAIGNLHSACSQHEAYRKALTPRLEQLLWGIKKDQGSKCTPLIHLPITVEIMSRILSVVSKSPTYYQNVMMWGASCIAFFGFLRVGEMTVPSPESLDQVVHLTVEDVTLDSRSNPSIVWVNIK